MRTHETRTVELRWFADGSVPEEVKRWFERIRDRPPLSRTDLYLHPGDAELNVKLRGDSDVIQVKQRFGSTDVRLCETLAGSAEEWYKWSFDLDESPPFPDVDSTGRWIPVEKSRRKIHLNSTRLSEAFPADPDFEVEAEYANVSIGERNVWTFCIEVEGPHVPTESLVEYGSAVIDDAFPCSFEPSQSFGYSRLLERVVSANTVAETT